MSNDTMSAEEIVRALAEASGHLESGRVTDE